MGLLAIDLVKTLDELDPSLRKVFIKILEKIEQTLGEAVKRDDFIRLNHTLERLSNAVEELNKADLQIRENLTILSTTANELAEAQKRTEEKVKELAEAQKKTEERLNELAEAQKRTEEKVKELAEAQKKTEERLNELAEAQKRTEEKVKELAEAQKKTEEIVSKLTKEHQKTRETLGGLSNTVGYVLENEAFKHLPKLLMRDHQIKVTEKLKRDFIIYPNNKYEEVNILGKGLRGEEEIYILGECKVQLGKKDIDEFLRKVQRIRRILEGKYFLVFVTHMPVSPYIIPYAQSKGVYVYRSDDFIEVRV